MANPKWLRFVEPLFPVVIVAAGVALAPAFLLSGDPPRQPDTAVERFVGKPVVVENEYLGCTVAGNVYSASLVPSWRCGEDTFSKSPSRDVASADSAE